MCLKVHYLIIFFFLVAFEGFVEVVVHWGH